MRFGLIVGGANFCAKLPLKYVKKDFCLSYGFTNSGRHYDIAWEKNIMLKVMINLLCCLIPSRHLRHALRGTLKNKPFGVQDISKNNVSFKVHVGERTKNFWKGYARNEWEPTTFSIFDRFIDKKHGYMDIGAWIGPTVLYGASKARETFAFEPDRQAYISLEKNISLNPHLQEKISTFNFGVSSKSGKVKFYIGDGATSMSSVLQNRVNQARHYYADFFDIEYIVDNHDINIKNIGFIKIDIEGGEYELLPALTDYFLKIQHFPSLLISTHAHLLVQEIPDMSEANKICTKLNTKLLTDLQHYPTILSSDLVEITDIKQFVCDNPLHFDVVATFQ